MISAFRKTLPDVTVHVHELAHYLYDLGDEYSAMGGCVQTQLPQPPQPPFTVCLMENYPDSSHSCWVDSTGLSRAVFPDDPHDYVTDWKQHPAECAFQQGTLLHFCWDGAVTAMGPVPGDHQKATATDQNSRHAGLSCWTVMADDAKHQNIPYGLVYPGAKPIAAGVAAPVVLTEVTPLTPVERFALVLDTSGSMAGAKLDGMIFGADYYIDDVEAGKELALFSFLDAPNPQGPLEVVPAGTAAAWRQDRKDFRRRSHRGGTHRDRQGAGCCAPGPHAGGRRRRGADGHPPQRRQGNRRQSSRSLDDSGSRRVERPRLPDRLRRRSGSRDPSVSRDENGREVPAGGRHLDGHRGRRRDQEHDDLFGRRIRRGQPGRGLCGDRRDVRRRFGIRAFPVGPDPPRRGNRLDPARVPGVPPSRFRPAARNARWAAPGRRGTRISSSSSCLLGRRNR
jgi:hypothetical protein